MGVERTFDRGDDPLTGFGLEICSRGQPPCNLLKDIQGDVCGHPATKI